MNLSYPPSEPVEWLCSLKPGTDSNLLASLGQHLSVTILSKSRYEARNKAAVALGCEPDQLNVTPVVPLSRNKPGRIG